MRYEERTRGLLGLLKRTFAKYISVGEHALVALPLWTAHTHVFEAFDFTPFLSISSPEKRCGKTRACEVLELTCRSAWLVTRPTEAVLFRKIEQDAPTLIIDEVDTVFTEKGESAEGLRGLLNASNRRGAVVPRCVGSTHQLKDFPTYCPKVLAGIGSLPDTLSDRSIIIRMERRRPGEVVERFRRRWVEGELRMLRDELGDWAGTVVEELRDAEPHLPDTLSDRAQDCWEPLLTIADLAAGEWPARARAAAVALSGGEDLDTPSLGILTLRALRDRFGELKTDRLYTTEVLAALIARDDGPWAGWWARDIAAGDAQGPASRLARILRPYGIRSTTVRSGEHVAKGYLRDDCAEVFSRYLPSPSDSRYTRNSRNTPGTPDVDCNGVTAVTAPGGETDLRAEVLRLGRVHGADLTEFVETATDAELVEARAFYRDRGVA